MPLNDAIFRNVGDLMNLFPIGYLRRYSLNKNLYPLDLEMAKTAVEKYVLTFPLRTFDGTFLLVEEASVSIRVHQRNRWTMLHFCGLMINIWA